MGLIVSGTLQKIRGMAMDLGLKGKVALIAGASQGMGRATALGFAREGAKVSICARGEAALNKAAAMIRKESGGEVVTMVADMSKPEDISATMVTTSPPLSLRIIAAALFNAASPRAQMLTFAPSRAKPNAVARPMPWLAPAISATLPFNPRSIASPPIFEVCRILSDPSQTVKSRGPSL